MSVNKVIILGRLGGDPELKYTPGGMAVCNFTVATSETWADKSGQKQERTEWHRIVVWGKLAELCNQYLAKGRQAFIEGTLQTRSWDDKAGGKRYTTEINAKTIQFIGGTPNASNHSEDAGESRGAKSSDSKAPKNNKSQNQSQGKSSDQTSGQSQDPGPSDDNFSEYDISTDTNFTADDIPF